MKSKDKLEYLRKQVVVLVLVAILMLAEAASAMGATSEQPADALVLEMTFPALQVSKTEEDGEVFYRLNMEGYGLSEEVGKPELPTLGRFVAVPEGAQVQTAVLDARYEVWEGYRVYPAQKPTSPESEKAPFALDRECYARNEFYPASAVQVEPEVVIRGLHVVIVRFYPVQYNPVSAQLRVHTYLRLQLTFHGGKGMQIAPRLRSPYYDALYQRLLANYGSLPKEEGGAGLASATGCEFLIITHPDFVEAANRLATWKRQKGIETEVRTTAEVGTTTEAIKSFIQNAYNTWNPAPSFVLFLGDAEFVPTNYLTPHPYENNRLIGTDLYYATVDGSDYFPDLSTGRIPVDTAAQADAVVSKIIGYEQSPPADTEFYTRIAMAAYFQDDNRDGYEDRSFILTSEQIRDFLLTKNYSVQRIYMAPSDANPTNYNNGVYASGEPLPAELLRSNGFTWSGSATNINDAVNAGCILLNHEGHGGLLGWGQPYYTTSHFSGLANGGNKLPVVFSMNCSTGWFDNETDGESATPDSAVYFAEGFLRLENAGAVGVVAATRTTFSGHNDTLHKGMIDALWPDFLSYTQSGPFANPQRRMGQVLDYGKMYYASLFSATTTRKIQFECYHYFGDPTMQLWISPPGSMSVSHAPNIPAGATSFSVRANVNGALVTVVKGGRMLGKATVVNGQAAVPLSPAPTEGAVVVTASELSHVPYQDDVPVASPTSVTLVSCQVKPGKGGVAISWETGSEIDNLGFNIYRSLRNDVATAVKINAELIPSRSPGSLAGASYTYLDTSAKSGVTYHYWLEDVKANQRPSAPTYYLGEGRWDMPLAVKVYPATGGTTAIGDQRFNALFKDLGQDLDTVYLLIGASPEAEKVIWVRYKVAENTLSIYDPRIRNWLPDAALGARVVRDIPYGSLRPAASQVRTGGVGEYLTVGWYLKFWARFRGQHNIYIRAVDRAGNDTGWKLAGTWAVW